MKQLKIIAILNLIITILMSSGCKTSLDKESSLSSADSNLSGHKLYSFISDNPDVDFLYSFTEEEQTRLLEAWNIKIPSNQPQTYIYSFGREEIRGEVLDNSSDRDFFYIEFGGVSDYNAFFEYNKHRVGENGLNGKSQNEVMMQYSTFDTDKYTSDYYLTYSEVFFCNTDDKMYDSLNLLFDSIKHKSTD